MDYRCWKTGRAVSGDGDQDNCWVRHGQDRFEKVPLKPSEGAGVSALFEDSQGRVWIGTRHGAVMYDGSGFQQLGPESGLPRSEITCFGEDNSGGLWVAGSEGVFHRETDQFTAIRDADNQPLRGVLCFKTDADGTLWMGTRAAGLIRWRNGKMDRIGAGHGLLEREVRGIIEDDQGYFWMPSDRGILRASRMQLHAVADDGLARLELQVLDQHDGLPSPECSTAQPNCARDAAGKLWFATQKGPAVIDPAAFRLNAQPPPVQVERLTYHVRKPRPDAAELRTPTAADSEFAFVAPFPSPLRIPPGAYSLDFEFAALSFSAPEKMQFQYLLEGQSQGWLDSRNSRRVSFHRLPPGDYVLRVRAANSDGVWNETGAVVAFSVLPFFWQTWSFQLATGFLLVALGGVSVWSWYYRKLARAEEWERSAIALRASHARLELASELAGLGYYEVDYGMRTCFLDDRFREICGVPAELMQGLDPVAFWLEHVCPEHRGRISEERQKLREGKTDQISAEYRYRHPALGEIWLHHNARVAERHPGGAGLRTFGVIRDITETKRTAEQLEEDSRYATLIADLSSRFVNLSPGEVDGAIEDAQRRVCEFLGLDLSALWQPVEGVPGDYQLTHHYRSVAGPPITRMSARDNFPWCQQQLLAGKVVVVASMDNLPSEAARDQEVWRHYGVKTSLTLPLSTWGSPAIGFLSFNDIRKERDWPEALVQRIHLIAEIFTNALARKRSDEGLRESLEINRATFEQAAAGIAHVAPDGHWLRVNDKFCAIVGYSREELMRLTFQDITHPDDLGKDLEHLRLMLAGEIDDLCSGEALLPQRPVSRLGQPDGFARADRPGRPQGLHLGGGGYYGTQAGRGGNAAVAVAALACGPRGTDRGHHGLVGARVKSAADRHSEHRPGGVTFPG